MNKKISSTLRGILSFMLFWCLVLIYPLTAFSQPIILVDVMSERTLFVCNNSDEQINNFWVTVFTSSIDVSNIYINGQEVTGYLIERVEIEGDQVTRIVFGTPENPINPIPGNSAAKIRLRYTTGVDMTYFSVGWQPETKTPLFGYN